MLNLLIRIMLLYASLHCVDGRKKSKVGSCSMQWKELVQFAEGKGIEQHVVVIGDSVARESYSYLKLCAGSGKVCNPSITALLSSKDHCAFKDEAILVDTWSRIFNSRCIFNPTVTRKKRPPDAKYYSMFFRDDAELVSKACEYGARVNLRSVIVPASSGIGINFVSHLGISHTWSTFYEELIKILASVSVRHSMIYISLGVHECHLYRKKNNITRLEKLLDTVEVGFPNARFFWREVQLYREHLLDPCMKDWQQQTNLLFQKSDRASHWNFIPFPNSRLVNHFGLHYFEPVIKRFVSPLQSFL